MHPLDSSLDESLHTSRPGPPARRRSSLDNSQLAAAATFRQLMPDEDDEFDEKTPKRRLSLNAKLQNANTTFLAEMSNSSSGRPKVDLDADFHNSIHSASKPRSILKGSKAAYVSDPEGSPTPLLADEDSSESSLESDCDSFCDASVQEPANREYIRKDLGASVFWNSAANDGFLDLEDEGNAAAFRGDEVVIEMMTDER